MTVDSPMQTLIDLLHQMQVLIYDLDDIEYAAPAAGRTSGGVGGHVRHCLDHVSALLTAIATGLCTYDRRVRGTDVETSRTAAMREAARLAMLVGRIDPALLDREVQVETQLDRDGTAMISRSTIGRELAFVISHTIHHNAIVAQILQARGLSIGPHFGLAPSTPADGEPLPCAQ